ncbi:FACT complex subunit SPT16 N-terminal lobe domain-containing protein, partial [Lentinula raphanica]
RQGTSHFIVTGSNVYILSGRARVQTKVAPSAAIAEALLFLAGDPAGEDESMKKGTFFQHWLLGYELPSTFLLFTKKKLCILCSASKAKILPQIEGPGGEIQVELFARAKAKDACNDALPRFSEIYASKKTAGILSKETHVGKLVLEWNKLVSEALNKPGLADMSVAVSAVMAQKDQENQYHVGPRLETILDKESKISHDTLAAQIEGRLGSGEGDNAKGPDMKVWSKGKGLEKIDWQLVEFAYSPIIISRSSKSGDDLRYTAESTEDNIAHKGVLNKRRNTAFFYHCKRNCSNSLLMESPHVKSINMHYVKEKHPEYEKNSVNNLGFGTGVEFRDSTYLLCPKDRQILRENLTLNLGLCFSGLVDADGSKWHKSTKDFLFFLTPESEDHKPKKPERKPLQVQPRANGTPFKYTVAGKMLRNNRRKAQDEVNETAAAKLAEHQRELHAKLQEEGLEKYSEGAGEKGGKECKGWIHQNGVRYQSPMGQKVDVLFSNIKHLFFQPFSNNSWEEEDIHVQFFREATDVQFDETGNRKRKHRYGDEDEIEMEQQERKRRQFLNKEIKAFAERIAEAASASNGEPLELDIPFRELSFEGVPFRTSVRLQPTTDCLIHLTDPPFLVMTLSEIEIASLERVQYSLKQFDLCLIFKDFTKPPLHINSIQSISMDNVKNWLDSVDIAMAEGPVNLNWGPIMKHINESPKGSESNALVTFFLLFLTPECEDNKPQKPERDAPVQPRANGTPSKYTVAEKTLSYSRRAAQDESHSSWRNIDGNYTHRFWLHCLDLSTPTRTDDMLELDMPSREYLFEGVPFRTSVRLQATITGIDYCYYIVEDRQRPYRFRDNIVGELIILGVIVIQVFTGNMFRNHFQHGRSNETKSSLRDHNVYKLEFSDGECRKNVDDSFRPAVASPRWMLWKCLWNHGRSATTKFHLQQWSDGPLVLLSVSRALIRLYTKRRARPTSRADGPGYLYAFIDDGRRFKIGMTKDFGRRKAEWDKQCPSTKRRWMAPIAVTRRRRAEALAHLLLELECSDRPRIRCLHCRKKHTEIFVFAPKRATAWRDIVKPLLLKAALALEHATRKKHAKRAPYHRDEALRYKKRTPPAYRNDAMEAREYRSYRNQFSPSPCYIKQLAPNEWLEGDRPRAMVNYRKSIFPRPKTRKEWNEVESGGMSDGQIGMSELHIGTGNHRIGMGN